MNNNTTGGGKEKYAKEPTLKELKCPVCLTVMRIRSIYQEHINSVTRVLKKYKYYQYHCETCKQSFTTTESDELSLKDFKFNN